MNYLDIDFPKNLSLCFSGGPEFTTVISETKNRAETRNQIWDSPKYRYNLINKICNRKVYNQLLNFFLICRGRKMAFNFLDYNDCRLSKQQIGVGDGKNLKFEIYKTYSHGECSFKRRIFKLKDVKVFVDNEEIESKHFIIEDGILFFAEDCVPPASSVITIDAFFFVVVRFDSDFLSVIRRSQSIELLDLCLVETQI